MASPTPQKITICQLTRTEPKMSTHAWGSSARERAKVATVHTPNSTMVKVKPSTPRFVATSHEMMENTQQNMLTMTTMSPQCKALPPVRKHASVAQPDSRYVPTTLTTAEVQTRQLSFAPNPGKHHSTMGTTMTYRAV